MVVGGNKGIDIDRRYLAWHRFADAIILISENTNEVQNMLNE